MTLEIALNLEKSGSFLDSLSKFEALFALDPLNRSVTDGLIRNTLRVGDINSLTARLLQIKENSTIDRQYIENWLSRLYLEIGKYREAKSFVLDLGSKDLRGFSGAHSILLKADCLAAEGLIEEAIGVLEGLENPNSETLRRIAELYLVLRRPEEAIQNLKKSVKYLNTKNATKNNSRRFITASGLFFHIINQTWLDCRLPIRGVLPTLSDSMKLIKSKTTKFELESDTSSVLNFDLSTSQSKKESLELNWSQIDLNNNDAVAMTQLCEFISRMKSKDYEISATYLQPWEKVSKFNVTYTIFVCEESGYVLSSNFQIGRDFEFAEMWESELRRYGKKLPTPRDLYVGGGLITRILANLIENNQLPDAVKIFNRNDFRRYRVLPNKYTSVI